MKKKTLSYLLCAALVILCSAFMPIILFFTNVGSVKFYEIAIFIGFFSTIALIIFVLFIFVFKSEHKASLSAGLIMIIFQNIGRLSSVMPYVFVLAIFILLSCALIFIIAKFVKDDISKLFVPVWSIVLVFIILLNSVLSISKIASVSNVKNEIQNDINTQYKYLSSYKNESTNPESLPNVYLIIVDEYAGFSSSEKYLNYDNSAFKSFLKSKNFTVSNSSTNYYDGTYECLANIFNLEVSEKNKIANTTEAYCEAKAADGALFKIAEDMGYTITAAQAVNVANYESRTKVYGDKWSDTGKGKSTIDLMISPSLLCPFVEELRSILNGVPLDYFRGRSHVINQASSFDAPLKYFADSENLSKHNTFNLCYTPIPHPPFFFDEKGNIIEGTSHLLDWSTPEYYINQLKYCNKLLEDTIENITTNDPDSIIVLMSDHGVRNYSTSSIQFDWMNQMSPKDHTDILCAVYYKGESFSDIDGFCGSNVLINVINKAWGYEIPLIKQSDDFYFNK